MQHGQAGVVERRAAARLAASLPLGLPEAGTQLKVTPSVPVPLQHAWLQGDSIPGGNAPQGVRGLLRMLFRDPGGEDKRDKRGGGRGGGSL